MSDYFLAQSLVGFRASVNAAFPNRDKTSDGWIGDASHQAHVSEHNPCWTCTGDQYGIVRAIDVDVDDNDPGRDLRTEVIASCIWHPAVWYVISNGKIYSRTYGFAAREYTGVNGHFHHVHISIQKTHAAAFDKTLLLRPKTPPKTTPGTPTGQTPEPPAVRDVTITGACIRRLANDKLGVDGECLTDCYQVMNVATYLYPAMAATTRPYFWKMVAEGNWAEAGRMLEYAVRIIQSSAKFPQDGVFGPKTAAFLTTRGYKINP